MSATTTLSPKAVIFDAYGTLFDVHSVIAAEQQIFPGHGDALSQLWRQKQIEYSSCARWPLPPSALRRALSGVLGHHARQLCAFPRENFSSRSAVRRKNV